MASSKCIICFAALTKGNDRNLVQSRGEFSAQIEINDLDFVVHPTSSYICRVCLRILQQRQALRKKLDELNQKLLHKYHEKAAANGLPLKRKAAKKALFTEGDSEEKTGSSFSCQTDENREEPIVFQPLLTSTPQKSKGPRSCVPPVETSKSSYVTVKVHWESKEITRTLPDELESLGKMLCRGTYTQIARSAWRCKQVREQIVVLFLKDVDRECSHICSKKNPSILRQTDKQSILNFSLQKLDEELKSRTPLLRSVMMVACFRKSKLDRNQLYLMPAVSMALSICFKNRSPYMTVIQLLNSLFIQHSSLMTTLRRLSVLRLVVSHTFLYKKLDEFGHNHNEKIMEKVKNESARLLTVWNTDELNDGANTVSGSDGDTAHITVETRNADNTPPSADKESYEVDNGRKIVFDNFDIHQSVHHMSEFHQNIDNHWVVHMSTENRISGNHLSMEKTSPKTVMDLSNGKFLPDRKEHANQRENYADLVSRILVDNIDCLQSLKDHVVYHIKHQYSKEMTNPTDVTFLGMIFENENSNEGMQSVIDEIHKYVPCAKTKNGMKFSCQGVVGDQLSVERGVNSLLQVANGLNADDRKDGLHFEIADFHTQMKFLQVCTCC